MVATRTDGQSNSSAWTLTDKNGYYEITQGLTTGTYTVKASDYAYLQKGEAPGYATDQKTGVKVSSGLETVNIEFNLLASAWISGKVTTTTGMPIFRAKVTATSPTSGGSGIEYTDIAGKYMIATGLTTGMYTLTATYQGNTVTKQNVQAIETTETPDQNFLMNVPSVGQIVGRVSDAVTKRPIFGASVRISGATTATVTTDEKGYYSYLAGAGSYTVTSMAPGYKTNSSTVAVTVGEIKDVYYPTASSLGFQVEKLSGSGSATISGTITGDSNPIPEFPVAAVPVIFSLTILTLLLVSRKIRRGKINIE